MPTKLYVGNLSFRTTGEELREAFSAVGTVESASTEAAVAVVVVVMAADAAAVGVTTAAAAVIVVAIATSANRAGKPKGQGKKRNGELGKRGNNVLPPLFLFPCLRFTFGQQALT